MVNYQRSISLDSLSVHEKKKESHITTYSDTCESKCMTYEKQIDVYDRIDPTL